MITRTLTGKTRFREEKRWFRPALLILQVEERLTGYGPLYQGAKESEAVDELKFRDLSICDLPAPIAIGSWVTINK